MVTDEMNRMLAHFVLETREIIDTPPEETPIANAEVNNNIDQNTSKNNTAFSPSNPVNPA